MSRITETAGFVLRMQRAIALALLVAVSAASCSIRLPDEIVEDLTPPDGQRPNNYSLGPNVDELSEK